MNLKIQYGSIAYTYGHELYHGVQWTYADIMPAHPVVPSCSSCANSYFTQVGARFPEDKRFYGWPTEEEADIYGTQIAYGAFVNAIGSNIDDIVYPSLNLTQRQLFFYANSIFGCNVHTGNIENPLQIYLPDAHYEVNGRLAQINDSRSTFQCAATDDMVFPDVS
ncbi:hypothetical protein PFISCL1PPCAC_26310, partial [Pristionchus fissidentatus]